MKLSQLSGAGLGLRRAFIPALESSKNLSDIDFLEVAPENWLKLGGRSRQTFDRLAEQFPIVLHGLSLSIGGPDDLDLTLIQSVKQFKEQYQCPLYTEHLSYCTDGGHLYDLMPIPFNEERAQYVIDRVKQVQDIMGERMALENASYYLRLPGSDMTELAFILTILEQADCYLHLDVNNVYVNSINHGYDAQSFIRQLPTERIVYGHIAGHEQKSKDLIIDTHGSEVIDPVWSLLEYSYQQHGVFPTLLERDFDFPELSTLLEEVNHIKHIQMISQSKHVRQSQG
ncbi:HvfB family MNIO-type RiPP peptide maturase [Marinicella gelatinilytica]|uniref:HvfB family MNIO-type RiPP peptide maturase n=1 Tax=Marinicella gelatinilytica TaxID=2996017 RepID=UPI002260DF12|nr:DUF692 domain-containing protein [Marinicella gelatinilytica]MCX7543992.1 DUF692 domain-containing protein [Marinicella gelatinilytica]